MVTYTLVCFNIYTLMLANNSLRHCLKARVEQKPHMVVLYKGNSDLTPLTCQSCSKIYSKRKKINLFSRFCPLIVVVTSIVRVYRSTYNNSLNMFLIYMTVDTWDTSEQSGAQ